MSAFEQAYAHILDAISARTQEAGVGAEPLELFSRVFGDYLEALATDPIAARVFLIEVYAAGPSAIERRLELQRGLTEAMAALAGAEGEDRFAIEALLAAVIGLVTARLAAGDTEGLLELHAPVVALAGRLGLGVSS